MIFSLAPEDLLAAYTSTDSNSANKQPPRRRGMTMNRPAVKLHNITTLQEIAV
jgi:hypothetical protein